MKIASIALSLSLFAGVTHSAGAVTIGRPAVNSAVSTVVSGATQLPVERGGTILAIDYSKRTVNIDGVVYMLPYTGLIVHNESRKRLDEKQKLKVGMQIRFTTDKSNYTYQVQIHEVWVTRLNEKG